MTCQLELLADHFLAEGAPFASPQTRAVSDRMYTAGGSGVVVDLSWRTSLLLQLSRSQLTRTAAIGGGGVGK